MEKINVKDPKFVGKLLRVVSFVALLVAEKIDPSEEETSGTPTKKSR